MPHVVKLKQIAPPYVLQQQMWRITKPKYSRNTVPENHHKIHTFCVKLYLNVKRT